MKIEALERYIFMNAATTKMKAPYHQIFILLLINNDIIKKRNIEFLIKKKFLSSKKSFNRRQVINLNRKAIFPQILVHNS